MSSKLSKSMIVAGGGLVASIFTMLARKVYEAGGTDEDIHRLATPEGEALLKEFADLIVKQPFKIWRTIKLGTGPKTAYDFRKAITDKGMCISDWANDILGKPAFTVATEETEVDLVVISVAELGFKNGAKREDIYIRAKELGLGLCPAEAGPRLCLQYANQPKDERLVIAMEPITDSGGNLRLFGVKRCDSDVWLYSYDDRPGHVWHSGNRFVFSRRK